MKPRILVCQVNDKKLIFHFHFINFFLQYLLIICQNHFYIKFLELYHLSYLLAIQNMYFIKNQFKVIKIVFYYSLLFNLLISSSIFSTILEYSRSLSALAKIFELFSGNVIYLSASLSKTFLQ